jgi:hypothetical protein
MSVVLSLPLLGRDLTDTGGHQVADRGRATCQPYDDRSAGPAGLVGHPGPVDQPRSYRVDVADDTFVVAAPAAVAAAVHDETAWARWWPDLAPVVTRDRGVKGVQWSVTGALLGSMEIWLEPWGDGVLVHWYLRADHGPGQVRRPRAGRPAARQRGEVDRRVRDWKGHVHALKDRLEAGRVPGSFRKDVKDRDVSADPT